MNPDAPVDFVNGQSFLLAGQKNPKSIANFAPVDSWLYFDPTKGPDASLQWLLALRGGRYGSGNAA